MLQISDILVDYEHTACEGKRERHQNDLYLRYNGMSRLRSATFEQHFAFRATFFGSSKFKQLFPLLVIFEQLFIDQNFTVGILACNTQLPFLQDF